MKIFGSWESVLRLVRMKETHWKTTRILGIKQRIKQRISTELVSMNEPHWKTMRISGISTEYILSRNILSILSLKEPGISTDREAVLSNMAPDTKVLDGRTAGRTDNAKTISLRLWREIIKRDAKLNA
ncbi:hypothetical protein DPMN_019027 [Dreissena polymorpha]|uniref:Uncharacterized protein n=1 Tax=Dreissena polymorpha TaxID=45954 RepID=A0A9D4S8X8_DREPO|nr:hypothetical protein DPMN_019027 [Dreissena polymorpha]